MTHSKGIGSALAALLITTFCAAGAVADDKPTDHLGKRLDIELGGLAMINLGSENPIDTGYWLQFGGAYHLTDDLAVEAHGGWGQGEAIYRTSPTSRFETDQTIWSGSAGLRWYLLGKRGGPARFYTSVGGGVLFGYLDDSPAFDPTNPGAFDFEQKTTGYLYFTPGVRLQAGNRSGLFIRMPFNITVEDIDQSFIAPQIGAFVSF